MADDVILNKVAIIQRCLGRIQDEYCNHEDELETNFTRQDSIVLNVQRACEASIDLAMHLVRVYKLGIPQDSRAAFSMLAEKGLIPVELSNRLQAMTGFRNVAVHDYQKLSLAVLRGILKDRLGDFSSFSTIALGLTKA